MITPVEFTPEELETMKKRASVLMEFVGTGEIPKGLEQLLEIVKDFSKDFVSEILSRVMTTEMRIKYREMAGNVRDIKLSPDKMILAILFFLKHPKLSGGVIITVEVEENEEEDKK